MEIVNSLFLGFIFLFSVVIHEVSHGFVADSLGDPTARLNGRLTLNPLRHLDVFGSILLPGMLFLSSLVSGRGIIFGWTKPVPVNPYNFKDKKYGTLKVALAGPISNFLIAIFFGLLIRFIRTSQHSLVQNLVFYFSYIIWVNLMLPVFNLWPFLPFDGFHVFSKLLPFSSEKLVILGRQNFLLSSIGAILFMMFIGIPFICQPLFKLLTGFSI